MELFELYSKEKANFFLKLFFIKIRCVVNVDDICGLLRNRWGTAKWLIYDGPSLNSFFIFL